VHAADRLRYSILLSGKTLLQDSPILDEDRSADARVATKVLDTKGRTVDQSVEPAVRQKFASLREHYNELRLELAGNYAVVFRAFTRAWPIE